MIIIAIDPGLKGAVGAFRGSKCIRMLDMPVCSLKVGGKDKSKMFVDEVIPWIEALKEEFPDEEFHILLEEQHSWGNTEDKMGKSASFGYAASYGELQGVFKGKGWGYTLVPYGTWIPAVRCGSGKHAHVVRALQVAPGTDLKGPRGGLKDGRADVVLINWYWHITHQKGNH